MTSILRFCFASIFLSASALGQTPAESGADALEAIAQAESVDPTQGAASDALALEAFVDGVIESARVQHRIPGVAVSVVQDGQPLFSKGYGYADLEASTQVDPDNSLFRIGSVSKTFVWTAAMILVDRGALDLDVDVNDYLKGVAIPNTFDEPITMAHLMAHRAGFDETMTIIMYPDGEVYDFAEVLQESMPELVFPPGERTSYSNWGTALATKVIEDISGQPFETFLTEEILNPLGMDGVSLYGRRADPPEIGRNVSLGYEMLGGGVGVYDTPHMGPFWSVGAMGVSAADIAKWSLFHLNRGELDGVRLLSEDAYARMRDRAFDDRPNSADMANGFMEFIYKDLLFYGHGGSTGDFLTNWMLVPEKNLGVFVSQNSEATYHLVYSLPTLIVDFLDDSFVKHTLVSQTGSDAGADAGPQRDLSEYAGQFHSNRQSFSTFEKTFTMYNTISVTPNGAGALSIYNGISETEGLYYPLDADRDVFVDHNHSRIYFGRDASGQVVYMAGAYGTGTFERIGPFENASTLNLSIALATLLSLTLLIGAWRRHGTAVQQTVLGSRLGLLNLVLPLTVFVLIISIEMATNILAPTSDAHMAFDYPPFRFQFVRVSGLLILVATIISVGGSYFVLRSSGWSVWRKVHHVLFALSLLFLTSQLVFWNVIFAPIV